MAEKVRTITNEALIEDQELELRIQAEGLLLRAEMLAWERTGNSAAHGAAELHQARMFELIKTRTAEATNKTQRVVA